MCRSQIAKNGNHNFESVILNLRKSRETNNLGNKKNSNFLFLIFSPIFSANKQTSKQKQKKNADNFCEDQQNQNPNFQINFKNKRICIRIHCEELGFADYLFRESRKRLGEIREEIWFERG